MSEPLEPEIDEGTSAILSVVSGSAIIAWGQDTDVQNRADTRLQLLLNPERPVIIGRYEGRDVPYLDPAYRPTTVMPGTHQTILQGEAADTYVSRGHFMLRAITGGIILVNGVPKRGGGIRPPSNWTRLLCPTNRQLAPAESYLIEQGTSVELLLPNETQLRIAAE